VPRLIRPGSAIEVIAGTIPMRLYTLYIYIYIYITELCSREYLCISVCAIVFFFIAEGFMFLSGKLFVCYEQVP